MYHLAMSLLKQHVSPRYEFIMLFDSIHLRSVEII
jgi:hypothetical protein